MRDMSTMCRATRLRAGRGAATLGVCLVLWACTADGAPDAGSSMFERADAEGEQATSMFAQRPADAVQTAPAATSTSSAPQIVAGVVSGDELAAMLDELVVQAEHRDGYDRDAWPHWGEGRSGDGLNVRGEVLEDESWCPVRVQSGYVRAGCWWSVYDGQWFEDPALVDVDHIVALQEAHDSGGHSWDVSAREAFANWRAGLVAVSSASNRAKSGSDPARWLPADPTVRCAFVRSWLQIKHAWALSVDSDEHAALAEAISQCPTAAVLHAAEPQQ